MIEISITVTQAGREFIKRGRLTEPSIPLEGYDLIEAEITRKTKALLNDYAYYFSGNSDQSYRLWKADNNK